MPGTSVVPYVKEMLKRENMTHLRVGVSAANSVQFMQDMGEAAFDFTLQERQLNPTALQKEYLKALNGFIANEMKLRDFRATKMAGGTVTLAKTVSGISREELGAEVVLTAAEITPASLKKAEQEAMAAVRRKMHALTA